MLVAMDSTNWVLGFSGEKCLSLPVSNDSFIILPPIKNNRQKAIQWSKDSIPELKRLVPSHPKNGIKA